MGIESIHSAEGHDPMFRLREEIQGAFVMKAQSGIGKSEEEREARNNEALKWLSVYSKYSPERIFERVFDKYASLHPNLIDDWNNLDTREKVFEDISNCLENYPEYLKEAA